MPISNFEYKNKSHVYFFYWLDFFKKSELNPEFPTDLISESEQMDARTKDGMQITLNMSYQYKLNQELLSIVNLVKKWGEGNYKRGFNRIAKNVLKWVFTFRNFIFLFIFFWNILKK